MGIEFFPIVKKEKYVPPKEDVIKVVMAADPDTKDYLWTIICTMGRMGEINMLKWSDVNLKEKIPGSLHKKEKGRSSHSQADSNQ